MTRDYTSQEWQLLKAIQDGDVAGAANQLEQGAVEVANLRDAILENPGMLQGLMDAISLIKATYTRLRNTRRLAAMCLGAGGSAWIEFINLEQARLACDGEDISPTPQLTTTQNIELRDIAMCELLAGGWSLADIGAGFGISSVRVGQICSKRGVHSRNSFKGDSHA